MAAGEPKVAHLRSRCGKADEIDLVARLIVALDLEEGEGARGLGAFARPQRAEHLAHIAIVVSAMHGDQRVLRLRA